MPEDPGITDQQDDEKITGGAAEPVVTPPEKTVDAPVQETKPAPEEKKPDAPPPAPEKTVDLPVQETTAVTEEKKPPEEKKPDAPPPAPEKKPGHLKRNLLILLVGIIVVFAAGALTFEFDPDLPASSESFPFTASYDVLFPQGQSVDFAGTYITATGTGDRVIISVAGQEGYEMKVGETRTFASPKRVVVKIFGITLLDSSYTIDAEFRGFVPSAGKNDFYMIIKTSEQLPQYLVNELMPDEVNARPF